MTKRKNCRAVLGAVAWALLTVSGPAFAANEAETTQIGNAVSIFGDKLVMKSVGGADQSLALAAGVKFTLDGKPCMAADLKPGMRIRVTIRGSEKGEVARIEGLDAKPAFASYRHDGKVIRVTDGKLVMVGTPGEVEQTLNLPADVQVTLDEKACKASDLKPGMRIRVTSASEDPFAATRIEAIAKNPGFVGI